MTVSADEFLRRFLIHVLPKGLVRIRHFSGLFANRNRSVSLLRCRFLLNAAALLQQPAPSSDQVPALRRAHACRRTDHQPPASICVQHFIPYASSR